MRTQKLETVDAFIVFDLDDADTSMGVTRLAPKILIDGARSLARSSTYQFASFELKIGGASAGINSLADGREGAVQAFVAEVAPLVESGRFLTEAAKGVTDTDLASFRLLDRRSPDYWVEGPHLQTLGIVVAAETALGSLEGRTIAIEGYRRDTDLAAQLVARGARIVAVGTPAGTVLDAAGLDVEQLVGDPVATAGAGVWGPTDVLGAEVDVLIAGSRTGVIDHLAASGIRAGVVVPGGPLPVTAKGLAVLRRAGVSVLPDFVTLAGPLFAAFPPEGRSAEQLTETVTRRVSGSLAELLDHEDGPLLSACYRAEAFLATWCPTLPFGRPLA